MTTYQMTLDGGLAMKTGLGRTCDQLAEIMEQEPETRGDEDLLAAKWLIRCKGVDWVSAYGLRDLLEMVRQANIRERRRELAVSGLYPWPDDEAERRQKRGRGGRPG